MEDEGQPQAQPPSVAVLFLVFMFCWPLAIVMAYRAGYFHRNGKLDPINVVFAALGMALVLYIVVAIALSG